MEKVLAKLNLAEYRAWLKSFLPLRETNPVSVTTTERAGAEELMVGFKHVAPTENTAVAIRNLQADIWLLSMDQEEGRPDVSKLTREYCKDMKGENRPIILSHNKLPNLIEDHEFMKIDDPMCAIFMEDEEQDIPVKIRNAFCPAKVAKGNPCLEYIKHIVLPWFGYFEVPRKEENSGSRTFQKMEELITDYESGALHPTEVKLALTKALNKIMK
ncbi:tyrosine--tRNA ligase 1, cytoplasmic-like, partial [Triticum urartu]|uniref:tyrosine--tRNA ligase 1, cytoplasmic-like n=1 Tax=Triticum urartu TaxID=4572 RepID=UPI002043299E